MTYSKIALSTAIALLMAIGSAHADVVIFDADFDGSTEAATNIDNNATVSNLALGTATGTWAVSGPFGTPGGIFTDGAGNGAFTIDSRVANQSNTGAGDFSGFANGIFANTVDLAGGDTLSFSFDIFAAREGGIGGGIREINFSLQDAAGNSAYAISFNQLGTKSFGTIDAAGTETTFVTAATGASDFVNPGPGSYPSANGNVATVQIDVTGVGLATASVDFDGDGVFDGTAALPDLGAIASLSQFQIDFGQSSNVSGAYIDNILADATFATIPEPGSFVVLGGLAALTIVRRKR